MARTAKKTISIYDNEVLLTTDVNSIDFAGAGVSGSVDVNGNVIENIPGGSGGGGFTYSNEIVAGSGTTFTLAHVPISPTGLLLMGGGSVLIPGAGKDYTISGAVITMANSYNSGQVVAFYS